MTIEDFPAFAREHWASIRQAVRDETYQPSPVRRTEVPKRHGQGQRLLGIPTVEDKLVPRAVAMLLGAIAEQDFPDCAYGFRAGRSPHHARTELREQCRGKNIHWIIDADLRGCFDEASCYSCPKPAR
jgi:retron-type reverse transcriptase